MAYNCIGKVYYIDKINKMKIGILTHPLRTNYGGVLQNYALQHAIKSLGHSVETIDWQEHKNVAYIMTSYIYRLFMHHILRKKNIPTDIFLNLTKQQFLYISSNIQQFIKQNIQRSKYIPSIKKLYKANAYHYDAIVVGSDQVWANQYVPSMYLDFVSNSNVKKVAYAASFGKDTWTYNDYQTERCSQLAKEFDAISVREDSGVSLCNQYLGVAAKQVLDPTLLLDSSVYSSLIEKGEGDVKPYIMTYVLDVNEYKKDVIDGVSKLLQLPEFTIRENKQTWKLFRDNSNLVVKPIESWLKGIRDSEFVVTDSFHGVAFSIIFNNQFLAIGNKKRGLARFQSILKQFDLLDRLVDENTDINEYLKGLKEINYDTVNKKKAKLQEQSLCFLKNALN